MNTEQQRYAVPESGKWERHREDWQFIDPTGRIIGVVEESSCIGDADEWSAAVCPLCERAENTYRTLHVRDIGRYTTEKAAKKAVELWWVDACTPKEKR